MTGRSCSLLAGALLLVLLTACTSAGLTVHPRVTRSAPAVTGAYVALGDSFTAAPLTGAQGGPAGCLRSVKDYPSLVAAALGASVSLTNVSCYGATTGDLSHAQHTAGQQNPAQLGALSAADRLVTVQIGGDDIGFGRIASTCGALRPRSSPGTPRINAARPSARRDARSRSIPSSQARSTSSRD